MFNFTTKTYTRIGFIVGGVVLFAFGLFDVTNSLTTLSSNADVALTTAGFATAVFARF